MKKNIIAITLSALSFPALAVVGGIEVNWQKDFDDIVKNNCTSLIVGGDKVLTAAHCTDLTGITFANGSVTTANSRIDHPKYTYSSYGSQYDVSVWTLSQVAETQNIHYFANLNNQTVAVSDKIKTYGFGGNNLLAYAEMNINKTSLSTETSFEATSQFGYTIQGDSGGIWLKGNEIVAINRSGSGRMAQGTDLYYAQDFILENVNGWHYPTVLKGTGTQTIKVQSLHQNGVADSAYVEGDVTITGGTCQTKTTINAFDTCTYELDAKGAGKLHLSSNEEIDINPAAPKPVPPSTAPSSSGGGSGGSTSIFSLIVLGAFGILRRRKQTT